MDHSAVDLLNLTMNDAIPSYGDDIPLSTTAIRAAAGIIVSLLTRATHTEIRQLLTSDSASKYGPYQIHRAAVIVSRALNEAASRSAPEDAKPAWPEKALQSAILLVDDVVAMAISCGLGADCQQSPHVWTPSAITATCRIIRDVMDDGSLARQWTQPPVIVADDDGRDRSGFEQEAARLDIIAHQPSSIAMVPSDIISVGSNNNSRPIYDDVPRRSDDASRASAAAAAGERRSEVAPLRDSDNSNNSGSAGGLLRRMFGRRRRDV